jgi:hypothetical protein
MPWECAAAISHAFWNQRFNGDPTAIGATIKISSDIFTIRSVGGFSAVSIRGSS